jgi:hypothetical protein
MLTRLIARCCVPVAAALMAAACGAQVLGAPGTLPNGRQMPVPPGQQTPPETTPRQQIPSPAPGAAGSSQGAPAAAAALTAPSLLDKPAQPATVSLSGGRLSVTADNSSLTAILHQLASTSGMTIDGLDADTRIFGTYGPGDPRDILSQLLDGAGYNVMMVGDTSAGTPRQLLLTVRSDAPIAQPQGRTVVEPDDDQMDDNVPLNNNPPPGEIQPHPRMAPMQPPQQQNPDGTAKTPQQILQEMQQQRQQQQQEQLQQNPQ